MTHLGAKPSPRAFAAIVRYTTAAATPGRRSGMLAVAIGASIGFGVLAHAVEGPNDAAFAEIASAALFGVVYPLGCLVVGDAVLAGEIRSGVLPFTWLSPTPFAVVVAGRWIGGWLVAAAVLGPAFAAAAVAAGAPGSAGAAALAAVVGAGAYVPVFMAIGVMARRATVWSLAIVFLVERLLGAALSGVAQWSPTWLGRAVFTGLGPGTEEFTRAGVPEGVGAVVRLAVVAAVALALSVWRIARVRFAGSED